MLYHLLKYKQAAICSNHSDKQTFSGDFIEWQLMKRFNYLNQIEHLLSKLKQGQLEVLYDQKKKVYSLER